MPYYHECPDCGVNLDPGERCDCGKEKALGGVATPTRAKEISTKPYYEAQERKCQYDQGANNSYGAWNSRPSARV